MSDEAPNSRNRRPRDRWRRVAAAFDHKRALGALTVAVVGGLIVGFVLRATGGDEDSSTGDRGALPTVGRSAEEQEPPLPRSDRPAPVDMNAYGHIITGPGEGEKPSEVVRVQHGNVVQVGSTVQNPSGDPNQVLTNVKLEIALPTTFGKTATINVSVTADNAQHARDYRQADTVVLNSADGAPFRSGVPRTFIYQENDSGEVGRFDWGRYRYVPRRAITARIEGGEHRVTVRPLSDGTLGPSSEEIFRVFFLLDIANT